MQSLILFLIASLLVVSAYAQTAAPEDSCNYKLVIPDSLQNKKGRFTMFVMRGDIRKRGADHLRKQLVLTHGTSYQLDRPSLDNVFSPACRLKKYTLVKLEVKPNTIYPPNPDPSITFILEFEKRSE